MRNTNVWDVWPWTPRLFYALAMQGVLRISLPIASMPVRADRSDPTERGALVAYAAAPKSGRAHGRAGVVKG